MMEKKNVNTYLRSVPRLAGIGMLCLLAACSGRKPVNPPVALVDFTQTAKVEKVWSVSVGKSVSTSFVPAVSGDAVYAASESGTVVRVNLRTGQPDWQISAGLPLSAGVASDGFTTIVAGGRGVVLAYDAATGKERWRAQASSEVLSAPAVGQGIVVVRSIDNKITAFDEQTGEQRWVSQRMAPALTLRSAPGIMLVQDAALVALPGGRLSALSLQNGGPLWEVAVAEPRGATEIERIADVSGFPVVGTNEVCAAAYQGRVACFELYSGNPLWSKAFSSEVGVAMSGMSLFAVDENARVTAFGRENGNALWRNDKMLNRRLSAVVPVSRDFVAAGDYQGYVHFLSEDNGALKARIATDGSAVMPSPVSANGMAIFQTKAGTLVALSAH